MTSTAVAEHEVILCVGDTTFLDYGSIKLKREEYGPIGNGGNGLILHSALAIDPKLGQPVGLLGHALHKCGIDSNVIPSPRTIS
jgi:hypothetical protein